MIKVVAIHEFLFTIKRKVFYIVTLGMPLIALAYLGLISLIAYASVPDELKRQGMPIGLIDHSGILVGLGGELHGVGLGEIYTVEHTPQELKDLKEALPVDLDKLDIPGLQSRIQLCADLDAARPLLEREALSSVIVIPEDYLDQGRLRHYFRERRLMTAKDRLSFLRQMLVTNLLRQSSIPEKRIQRIQSRASIQEFELDPAGEFVQVNLWEKGFSIGVPIGVAALLVVALMMNSSLLLASVAEEKENKVMEIILSSVSSDQLLFGKVLGLVAAGLLQILIWMAMASVVPSMIMTAVQQQVPYDINVWHILIGVMFVLLGFVFYGCLLAGLGSLGNTYKDCQQLSVAVILCACVPLMTWMTFLNDPNGAVARLLSLIPLFSPLAMMLRLGIADVPAWEVLLSLGILSVSIWAALKISSKLFRAGTLMYGKKPGPREIWKTLRQPA